MGGGIVPGRWGRVKGNNMGPVISEPPWILYESWVLHEFCELLSESSVRSMGCFVQFCR